MPRSKFTIHAITYAMLLILAASFLVSIPAASHAATDGGPTIGSTVSDGGETSSNGVLINPLKFGTLEELIAAILAAVVKLGATILVFMLIFTGFKFVAAQGSEEKLRDAKRALLWTIIGGLILLGATAIMEVVRATVTSVTP